MRQEYAKGTYCKLQTKTSLAQEEPENKLEASSGNLGTKGGSAMHLKIVGSSSSGNSYILETQSGSLLIECGIQFKKIQQALGYDLSSVRGCLISHEHL